MDDSSKTLLPLQQLNNASLFHPSWRKAKKNNSFFSFKLQISSEFLRLESSQQYLLLTIRWSLFISPVRYEQCAYIWHCVCMQCWFNFRQHFIIKQTRPSLSLVSGPRLHIVLVVRVSYYGVVDWSLNSYGLTRKINSALICLMILLVGVPGVRTRRTEVMLVN